MLTPKMEIRNLTRAYQWLFPRIDPATGQVRRDLEVGRWQCDPTMWLDGTCDCNCGRFDPDCGGKTGKPLEYADSLVNDPTVKVRINCPHGPGMLFFYSLFFLNI